MGRLQVARTRQALLLGALALETLPLGGARGAYSASQHTDAATLAGLLEDLVTPAVTHASPAVRKDALR